MCAKDDKAIANPVVVLREEFDDWAVLFNPDTAKAAGIDPVGVVVWKHLDGRHEIEQLVAAVREGFDEVSDDVTDEVRRFVGQLVEQGFAGYAASEG